MENKKLTKKEKYKWFLREQEIKQTKEDIKGVFGWDEENCLI